MKRQDRQRYSAKLCLESLSIAFEEFPLAAFLKCVAYPPPYRLSARANRPAPRVHAGAPAKIGWKDRTTAKRSAESPSAAAEWRRWIGRSWPVASRGSHRPIFLISIRFVATLPRPSALAKPT